MTLVAISLFYIIGVLVYKYLTWNFGYWEKRGVRGPKPRPYFGSFPSIATRKRNIVYDFDEVYRQYKRTDKFVGVFMTRIPEILVLDPDLAHDILVTNFKSFHDNESSRWSNRSYEPIAGGNPFVLTGQEWKDRRSEIVPALTTAKMKSVYPCLKQVCNKMSTYLTKNGAAEQGIDANKLSLKFTGEVVADVVWGIDAGAFDSEDDSVFISKSMEIIATTFDRIAFYFTGKLCPSLWKLKHFRFSPHPTDAFFVKLLHDAIALRLETKSDRADILNFLMQLKDKKNLSHLDLVTHSLTVLFDGFETSAALIAHCMLCLARHADVQDRLRQEVESRLEEDGFLSFETLNELPYLDQVVNETLRLFPPLSFKSKICTAPYDLANPDGSRVRLDVGQIVQIPTFSFHYNEDYFPEPENFIPERFSTPTGGSQKPKDNYAFLPFGDGPRVCLGMKYALAQTKAAIVEVVRSFQMTAHERTRQDNRIDPRNFITMLDGGIHLKFEPL